MIDEWNRIEKPDSDDLLYDREEDPESVAGSDVCEVWVDDAEKRNIVVYNSETGYHVARVWRKYVGPVVDDVVDSLDEAWSFAKGLRVSWNGVDAYENEEDHPRGSDVEFCPFCLNSPEQFPNPEELGGQMTKTEENWNQFNYECPSCGGWFSAPLRSGPTESPYDYWTLMFVPEKEDDKIESIKAVKLVQTDEEGPVKAARAEFNMKYGGCSEIQGVDWAIKNFYRLIVENYDFEEEIEGEVGDWLPGFNNSEGDNDGE